MWILPWLFQAVTNVTVSAETKSRLIVTGLITLVVVIAGATITGMVWSYGSRQEQAGYNRAYREINAETDSANSRIDAERRAWQEKIDKANAERDDAIAQAKMILSQPPQPVSIPQCSKPLEPKQIVALCSTPADARRKINSIH